MYILRILELPDKAKQEYGHRQAWSLASLHLSFFG